MGTITYNCDAAGNLLTSTDARGTLTSRAYDALNRLVQVNYADGQSAVYAYDQGANGLGRLTSLTDASGSTAWFYAAPTFALTSPANNMAFTGPATVNLSATAANSGGTVSKVEFYRGTTLIATVTTPSSGTTSSGTWTYSDTNVAAGTYSYTAKAYDNTNAVTTSVGALVTVSATSAGSGNVFYIHADHLNTPRLITNPAQQAVWRWDQAEPFGAYPADSNPSGLGVFEFNLRFPGQYFDAETNLHYNYFRDYDPAIGRYVQSDPIGLDGGINTYLYATDPLTQTDPFGLMGRGGMPTRPPSTPRPLRFGGGAAEPLSCQVKCTITDPKLLGCSAFGMAISITLGGGATGMGAAIATMLACRNVSYQTYCERECEDEKNRKNNQCSPSMKLQ